MGTINDDFVVLREFFLNWLNNWMFLFSGPIWATTILPTDRTGMCCSTTVKTWLTSSTNWSKEWLAFLSSCKKMTLCSFTRHGKRILMKVKEAAIFALASFHIPAHAKIIHNGLLQKRWKGISAKSSLMPPPPPPRHPMKTWLVRELNLVECHFN